MVFELPRWKLLSIENNSLGNKGQKRDVTYLREYSPDLRIYFIRPCSFLLKLKKSKITN